MNLEERIKNEIKKKRFSYLEIAEFKQDPELALSYGAIIGYELGMNDFAKQANKAIDKVVKKIENY